MRHASGPVHPDRAAHRADLLPYFRAHELRVPAAGGALDQHRHHVACGVVVLVTRAGLIDNGIFGDDDLVMARMQESAGYHVFRTLGRQLRKKARSHVQQVANENLLAPRIALPLAHEIGHRLIEGRYIAQHQSAPDHEGRDLLREGMRDDRRCAGMAAEVGFALDPSVPPDDERIGIIDFSVAFSVVQGLLRDRALPRRRGRKRNPVIGADRRFLVEVNLVRGPAHLRLLVALHVERFLFRREHQPDGKVLLRRLRLCHRSENSHTVCERNFAERPSHASDHTHAIIGGQSSSCRQRWPSRLTHY